MKKLTYCFALLFPFTAFSQHLLNLNNDVKNVVIKVIEDFPDHLNNINGDVIDKDVQSITFTSLVNIPGADSGIIIHNGNLNDNIYSWKETVFRSEDFDAAKTKFHEYFRKIKGTAVSIGDAKIIFDAGYNEPQDAKQFTTVLFMAHPQTEQLKDVVIDLSLHYLIDDWQISIGVYEHKDYGVDDKKSK